MESSKPPKFKITRRKPILWEWEVDQAILDQWKQAGQYLKSQALQALAVESAEAYAEFLHARLRNSGVFPIHLI